MGMIKIPDQSLNYFQEKFPEIIESGNLAEGQWNNAIADMVTSYTSAKHASVFNSNGSGLVTALKIFKEHRGKKKVFLQSNTMYGVKTIAYTSGLEISGFVDSDLDNLLMPTLNDVINFVNKLDKPEENVFLLTHIGGWVNPDIIEIAKFCKEKDILLLEDCAHSYGSLLDGKHTGLFGDAGVYSFYSTKAVPVGEGGVLVTNDDELHHHASKFIIYDRFDQNLNLGINFRMSEINALFAYSVIKESEHIFDSKLEIAKKYSSACDENEWSYQDALIDNQRSNLYKFILIAKTDNPIEEFSQITKRTSPVYDYTLGSDGTSIASKHICLPIWYKLEDEIVSEVIEELKR